MLFTDEVLFIHAPKTAGMAVTRYLIDNLPGEKFITLPEGHPAPGATVLPGHRHENLLTASEKLARRGCSLDAFRVIVAVIRNPYDLEVSRFHYLRLGRPWDAGITQEIAMAGDFERFAREAAYPKNVAVPIETYYTLNGQMPPNMRLLRQESLASDLEATFGPPSRPLQHLNVSEHDHWQDYITPAAEQAIFEKYRWLFRYYPRLYGR